MDLTLPISYNSFSINGTTRTNGGVPMSGYLVDEVNVSPVAVRGFTDDRALQDGIDASDVYLGRRTVEAIVTVFGSTKGDFWDKAQDLLSAFSPTLAYAADTANLGFLPFDFYQPTADISTWPISSFPNGIPLRFYLRPNGLPSYVSRRDEQGGISGKGISKQFRIPLLARDPRKVLQSQTTVSIATGTSSVQASATYRGDYPTTANLRITAASTGLFVAKIGSDSFSVSAETSNTTYIIDTAAKTLTKSNLSGTAIRMDLLVAYTSWPSIGPTSPVTTTRVSGNGSIAFWFREAFA